MTRSECRVWGAAKAPPLQVHWRGELQTELEANINFTHQLEASKRSLEKALAETEGPLRVTTECLYSREGRKEIDLVGDGVENSLHREVDKIKGCQARMSNCLAAVQQQLQTNKDCRHQLERDLANKDHGINIDHTVHQLNNVSRAINLHGGIEKHDPHVSIPESWADFSNRNIQASQGESRPDSQYRQLHCRRNMLRAFCSVTDRKIGVIFFIRLSALAIEMITLFSGRQTIVIAH